jgi:hypothetical protein
MKNLPDLLAAWSIALWVGGLWAIGAIAAPVLFYRLDDKILAGQLAGHMFTWVAWLGMACAAWLLIHRLGRIGPAAMKQAFFWIVVSMLLLNLAGHFGIQPILQQLKDQALPQDVMQSLVRDRFQAWHGISSVVYLLQALLGLWLVARQNGK